MSGWRWYIGLLRRRRWALLGIVALGALAPLGGLPALWLIRHALDHAIPTGDTGAILLAGAGILGFRLVPAVIAALAAFPAARTVRAVTGDMRIALMAQLHRLRWSDRDLIEGARAHSRIIAETDRVDQMTHALFHSTLPAIFPVLIYAGVLVVLSPMLALVVLVAAPPLRLLAWLAARRLKRAIAGFQHAFEQFHMGTHRAIRMLPVARMQASEEAALAEYRADSDALAAAGARMAAASTINIQANAVTATMVAVLVLVAGGIAVVQGTMTAGALAAFFVAATQANSAVNGLAGSLSTLFSGQEALRRLEELRALGREEKPAGSAAADFTGLIVLNAIDFTYPDQPILIGASMHAEPGQVTAIAAPNGEGKSTILELALGLLSPDAGEVTLAGTPVSALDPLLYRGRIGVLPQHPPFFRGTIRDNILFGRPGIPASALDRAIRIAGLEALIASQPLGLDAPIGDGGQLFSGGERQRIALARAVVHVPELLLLDEPGNHLDDEAVARLAQWLADDEDKPTILMATHDPRLLAAADRVYDLANGRLSERVPIRLAVSS